MKKQKILLVEDEDKMQFIISDNLESEGYFVEIASTGEEALELKSINNYDLVLLDNMLPGISGIDVCRVIREQDKLVPIIFLSAKSEEIDKVLGLEIGGDDYITKPFSVRELVSRIRANLRRRSLESNTVKNNSELIGEGIEVFFDQFKILKEGECLELSTYENKLLKYLFENQNNVISRDKLLAEVWEVNSNSTNRTIDNYISKLRAKIERDPSKPKYILTIHGAGYKLIVE